MQHTATTAADLAILKALFPDTFTTPPQPLAMSVRTELLAIEDSADRIDGALWEYIDSPEYERAIELQPATFYDLQGNICH